MRRSRVFPLGASVSLQDLEQQPYDLLASLREQEPVSWVPALEGWLVTPRRLALSVMRDAERFTVDDPRFTTGQVVGPSMLSLDGAAQERHRAPFARPFRLEAVSERFTTLAADETKQLLSVIAPRGRADLRREFAGPLAATIIAHSLGLADTDRYELLGWYEGIVNAVNELTAGRVLPRSGIEAFELLSAAIDPVLEQRPESSLLAAAGAAGGLTRDEVRANAAVMMFGGIETTEGMIVNAARHLLAEPGAHAAVLADPELLPNAIEESLRLEPAAAVVDRYAACEVELAGAAIRAGELVRVSLLAANRDPETFSEPNSFNLRRSNARQHIAFAHGPHVCLGMHLARLEAQAALSGLLRLPGLRLDDDASPQGLVFRKPAELHVAWNALPPRPAPGDSPALA